MEISKDQIRAGDILIFKRDPNDRLAGVLSAVLKVFYPRWDRYGWHMAFITRWHNGKNDWVVCEATWPKVRQNYLSLMGEFRAYRWLDKEPDYEDQIKPFLKWCLGCPYDVWKYIWTIACGLLHRLFRINLGRWDNDEYMCWELVEEFAEHMGKPFTVKNITLLLPDIQKILEV